MMFWAIYEQVETWGQGGILPYGVRVWRPHGIPAQRGKYVGSKFLRNGVLERLDGEVHYTQTYRLQVDLVRPEGSLEVLLVPPGSWRDDS